MDAMHYEDYFKEPAVTTRLVVVTILESGVSNYSRCLTVSLFLLAGTAVLRYILIWLEFVKPS